MPIDRQIIRNTHLCNRLTYNPRLNNRIITIRIREKEEQYWSEAEGVKSRAARKREEEFEKRAEVAARKAEVRRMVEQEQKELEKASKKHDKKANRVSVPVPKVTEAELRRRREEDQARILKKAEEEKRRKSRTAVEEEYERIVLVANTNRDDSIGLLFMLIGDSGNLTTMMYGERGTV